MQQKSNEALLVQHSNGISGFDLIKTKGKRETTGQLFDSTKRGGGAIKPVAQLWQHFIEQLEGKDAHTEQDTQNTLDQESLGSKREENISMTELLSEGVSECVYWPAADWEWVSLHTESCQFAEFYSWSPWWCHHNHCNTTEEKKKHNRDMKNVFYICKRCVCCISSPMCNTLQMIKVWLTLMYCLKMSAPVFISTTQ